MTAAAAVVVVGVCWIFLSVRYIIFIVAHFCFHDNCRSLSKLDIPGNDIGDKGILFICRALKVKYAALFMMTPV